MHNQNDPGTQGRLPEMAPLANPYVPFQMENPPKYDAGKGIIRGTLYPGLDLPFMGMVNNKPLSGSCMSELQTAAFAIQELALYLDTHPDDAEALALYQKYQQQYHTNCEVYRSKYGPLNHMTPSVGTKYQWLDDPWPWEYSKNKEV